MKRVLIFAFAVSLAAQDSRFEAHSRLVLVPVTVTDDMGRVVDGLQAADFLVLDDGRQQKITVDTIGTGVAPIALAVVVQSSGISYAVLDKVRKIGGMIRPLVTGERGCAALFSFAESVNWLTKCTHDPDAIEYAFRRLRPGDAKRGRMLDAVKAAVSHLKDQPNTRRVLLLISESRDRGSRTELSDATIAAQAEGVAVYAATYSALKTAFTSKEPSGLTGLADPIIPVPNPQAAQDGGNSNPFHHKYVSPQNSLDVIAAIGELKRLHDTNTTQVLAEATGGITLPFTRQAALEKIIEKLGAELHSQYVISFAPDPPEPGYHHLEVKLSRAGEFHIRARPGYWQAEKPQ